MLREGDPRIIGGRDLVAGGTWLAVNEHGVVAGLTNRPSPEGRDPTKRTRGVLPVALAAERAAEEAVRVAATLDPGEFNPCWLVVGDSHSLFLIDMTATDHGPGVTALDPGLVVLENRPPGAPSAKVSYVRRRMAGFEALDSAAFWRRLTSLLADHRVLDAGDGELPERPELSACCVHSDGYGTTSSALVALSPASGAAPSVWVADGPPCAAAFHDVTGYWQPDDASPISRAAPAASSPQPQPPGYPGGASRDRPPRARPASPER